MFLFVDEVAIILDYWTELFTQFIKSNFRSVKTNFEFPLFFGYNLFRYSKEFLLYAILHYYFRYVNSFYFFSNSLLTLFFSANACLFSIFLSIFQCYSSILTNVMKKDQMSAVLLKKVDYWGAIRIDLFWICWWHK